MEHQEFLFIIAEIAAVLAGFSAVILVVRPASDLSGFTTYTFTGVIQRSLATALLALLPALLDSWEYLSEYAWQVSSAIFAVYGVGEMYRTLTWWNGMNSVDRPVSELSFWWRAVLGCTFAVLAFGNVFLGYPALYLLHLFWMLLAISLLIFSYALSIAATNGD